MKGVIGLAALGCLLGVANAKILRWSSDNKDEASWVPPQQTLNFEARLGSYPPEPTTPPKLTDRAIDFFLHRRASTDNTCAYIDRDPEYSLYCDVTNYCGYNETNSHIGCCDDKRTTPCTIATACIDRTDSALYSTSNGLTLWCGRTSYPHCVTHLYKDSFTGYTLLGCGVAAATDSVWYKTANSTSSGLSSTRPSTSKSTSRSIAIDIDPGSGSTDPPSKPGPTSTTSGGSSTSSPAVVPESASSTPTGAIVGGVVGGLAAIALIILGVFFLIRHKKKDSEAGSHSGTAPINTNSPPNLGGPPGGSPVTQISQNQPVSPNPNQGYYGQAGLGAAGFTPVDNRTSLAPSYKTGGQFDNSISPPASPPPQTQSPVSAYQQSTPPPVGPYDPYAQQPPATYQNTPSSGYPSPPLPQGYVQQLSPGGYPEQSSPGAYGASAGGYRPPAQQQQQYAGYPPQQQQSNRFVSELPTQRGDGEVRELQG